MKNHWVRGVTLAALLAAKCRPEIRTQGTVSDDLRITVYDAAHVPREALLDVLERLRLILQQAKITSHPVPGNPDNPEASLFLYAAQPVRACGARRDIALKIVQASPGSLRESVLGMSSPYAALGLSARVFDDHIREAALRHNLSHGLVLSYAMAHEIGHVLLRSGSHSRTGIMSSLWTEYEYGQMARGALLFSTGEATATSANLRAPLCVEPRGRIPTW